MGHDCKTYVTLVWVFYIKLLELLLADGTSVHRQVVQLLIDVPA